MTLAPVLPVKAGETDKKPGMVQREQPQQQQETPRYCAATLEQMTRGHDSQQ